MVFLITRILDRVVVVKDWFACYYADTKSLLDLYNDFISGNLDKGEPIADKLCSRIKAFAGRSKTDLTECDPATKIVDIVSFLGPYIQFVVFSDGTDVDECNNIVKNTQKDAFSVLMSSASKASYLPEKFNNVTNNKLKLQNDVIEWLSEQQVGFLSTNKDTLGKSLVNTLADSLWYVDGNHLTLETRSCKIPLPLSHFKGYRTPGLSKKRKLDESCLQESSLRSHATALLLLSENSYFSRDKWTGVQKVIKDFGSTLLKYANYLANQKTRVSDGASKTSTFVGEKQKFEVLSQKHHIVPGPLSRYQSLHTAIIHSKDYTPILANDFSPGEPNRRFDYMKNMVVPVKCIKYTYTGAKEHLVFVWKVQVDASESDILNKNAEISAALLKTLPKYHTRAMRREFLSLFGRTTHSRAAFLREAYRRLTGDCSASLNADQSAVDKRVSDILDNEDSDLIWDLRVNNTGQPEKYSEFLEECQKHISEKIEVAVDERRHDKVDSDGDVITHLANAFSVRDLHEQVSSRCPPETKIPSKEWLRYQFWPRNSHFKSAQKYTGKLKIKFMVQSRQFRSKHIDMHYSSALFRYLKEFAIKYKDHSTLVCMDDKHKVKVGEPGYPVAMVERGKSVLVSMDKRFEVADHDFTKFSLTPSVSLIVDIPDSISETFYGGQVYVGFKENNFEASSPDRHAAELDSVLDMNNANKPILLMYTDGGPDHRITYGSVKISLINLFLKQNLDMLIAVRTPPGNSWKNPAERIMAILNLGFQGVGLMRQPTANFEPRLRSLSSISDIRKFAEKNPDIVEEIVDSIEPVKCLLNSVCHRLTWKGKPLKTFHSASAADISSLKDKVLSIDDTLSDGSTTQKDLMKKAKLNKFLESHCLSRHYMFCIKKCGKISCEHCMPPRVPDDIFEGFSFLPDPEPEDGDKYKSFSSLYGTETSEKFRPSLSKKVEPCHGMPFSPTAQTAKNVGIVVLCSECERPRVIYSKTVIKGAKRVQLNNILCDLSYSCGSVFADVETEDNHIIRSVYVRKNLSCEMTVELTYFSAGFPSVCYYCGSEDDLVENDDSYPVCDLCLSGKKPFVPKRGKFTNRHM